MTATGEEALSIREKGLGKDAPGFSDGLAVGTAPVIGAVLLGYSLFKALIDHADPANSYTGSSWFGVARSTGLREEATGAVLEPAPARAR